jgi:hypothetical protein
MALATYADLQGKILTWMARNDTETQSALPDFVNLAETRIKAVIDTLDGQRTQLITGDGGYDYALPSLFHRARALRGTSSGGDIYPLTYVTPTQWAYELSAYEKAGTPAYIYTLRGDLDNGRIISFGPAIASGAQFFLDYEARLNPLTNNNTTNWLLTNFPNVYLTACMIEAMDFERNEKGADHWTRKFNMIAGEVKDYLENEKWGGASLTIRSE